MRNHTIKGTVEKQILEYLALNPNQLIKPISGTLKVDYKSVNQAIHNLERKGYVEKGKLVETKKHGKYKAYKLSEQGIAIIFKISNNLDFQKFLENYEDELHLSERWKIWRRNFGESFIKKVFRLAGASYLETKDKKTEDWPTFIASASLLAINLMPNHERETLVKAINRDRRLSKDIYKIVRHIKRNVRELEET